MTSKHVLTETKEDNVESGFALRPCGSHAAPLEDEEEWKPVPGKRIREGEYHPNLSPL